MTGGGLQLPNLLWYYWAAQMRAAMFWFSRETNLPWVQVEMLAAKGLTLDSFLYSAPLNELKRKTENPFVKNTIMIWYEVHKFIGETPLLSCFSPIWGNEYFIPAKNDMGFKLWLNKGIVRLMDLYEDNILMSFDNLVSKFNIPRKHFFKYLQLRSFIFSKLKKSVQLPALSTLETFSTQECFSKGRITQLYNILVQNHKENSENKRREWMQDLNKDISLGEWGTICLKAQTQTINTRLRLLQYNWIMRTYITPVRLNKFNPSIPDLCFKCNIYQGTFCHCVWKCVEVQKFWRKVTHYISQFTTTPISLSPTICILGIDDDNYSLPNKEKKLVDLCLLQARRSIALCWKDISCPSLGLWLKNLISSLALEKLTYVIKGKSSEFYEIWDMFLRFVKEGDIEEAIDV